MPSSAPGPGTFQRIEQIMRRDLKLGPDIEITETTPFFGSDADIDSLDILLLLGSVEKEFGIKIPSEAVGREVFQDVGTLARYVDEFRSTGAAPPATGAPAGKQAADLLSRLPHGEPFRFVSKLLEVKEGESAKGVWSVAGTEAFFAGHFPGRPIVPGVLLAEALAQVSGLAAVGRQALTTLAHVDVRFEQPVTPPAEIILESRLTRSMATLRQFDVTASVNGAVVARGKLALSQAPDPH